jgi:hypothetical protein
MFAAEPVRRRGGRVRALLGIGFAVLALLVGSGFGRAPAAQAEASAPVSIVVATDSGASTSIDASTVVDAPARPVPVAAEPRRVSIPVPATPVARSADRSATAGRAPPQSR